VDSQASHAFAVPGLSSKHRRHVHEGCCDDDEEEELERVPWCGVGRLANGDYFLPGKCIRCWWIPKQQQEENGIRTHTRARTSPS